MGAWAEGSFDNDDAGDWVWELEEAEDVSILEEAFSAIIDNEDDLEAPDCSVAVAAAEVVAAMRQHPANNLPKEVQTFVSHVNNQPSESLITAALAALKRVRTKSELQELWDNGSNGENWRQAIAELESRLR
jgi:hypothetical protein